MRVLINMKIIVFLTFLATVVLGTTIPPDATIVYFDLETTGLSTQNAEIVQIAAVVSEKDVFSAYILPKRAIEPGATQATGFTKTPEGNLRQWDTIVETVPLETAMRDFVNFLKKTGGKVVLAAHNADRYDAPIILRTIQQVGLMESFLETVVGFLDTIPLMKKNVHTPKADLKTLAEHFGVYDKNAHDAVADSMMVMNIVKSAKIEHEELIENAKTVSRVILGDNTGPKTKLSKLKLTQDMLDDLANHGITLETLVNAAEEGETDKFDKVLHFMDRTTVENDKRVRDLQKAVKNFLHEQERKTADSKKKQ